MNFIYKAKFQSKEDFINSYNNIITNVKKDFDCTPIETLLENDFGMSFLKNVYGIKFRLDNEIQLNKLNLMISNNPLRSWKKNDVSRVEKS